MNRAWDKHDTLTDMWLCAGEELLVRGNEQDSRVGGTLELIDWHGTLTDIDQNFVLNSVRRVDPAYAAAEFIWYASGKDDVAMLLPYAPQYAKFAETDGKAYGAYGPRMWKNIITVIELLKKHPTTRQAVLVMWRPLDIAFAHKVNDMPCTVCLQFILRRGALHCICYMRSNDVWLGMPYDVFAFTMIQRLIANELKVEFGEYHHNVGSLHLYEKDQAKMRTSMSKTISSGGVDLIHGWDNFLSLQDMMETVRIEDEARVSGKCPILEPNSAAANDMVICCMNKLFNKSQALQSDILSCAEGLKVAV